MAPLPTILQHSLIFYLHIARTKISRPRHPVTKNIKCCIIRKLSPLSAIAIWWHVPTVVPQTSVDKVNIPYSRRGHDGQKARLGWQIYRKFVRLRKSWRNVIVTSRSCDVTSLFRRLRYDALDIQENEAWFQALKAWIGSIGTNASTARWYSRVQIADTIIWAIFTKRDK